MRQTIDDLITLFHPNYFSVDNSNTATGDTIVSSFKVEYDVDGIHMYVTVEE